MPQPSSAPTCVVLVRSRALRRSLAYRSTTRSRRRFGKACRWRASIRYRFDHEFIVACARNSALKSTHETLMARVERARFFALSSRARWDESVQEHLEILQALEKREAERAGKLLGHHVQRTGEVVNDALHARAGLIGESRPPAGEPISADA